MNADRGRRIAALDYHPESREQERTTTCNLCLSDVLVEVSRVDRYGYPSRLCLCSRCGLGFLSPRLTAAEYATFYESVYRPLVSAYHGRLIDATTVQEEQRAYGRNLATFLNASLPDSIAPQEILDIGGSTGVVAEEVRTTVRGTVTVLDPAPDELAVARAAGMETVEGLVEDFAAGEQRWDLVLLCQTADHLLDAASTFAGMRRVVSDAGYVFADVLDVGFMVDRRGRIEGAVKIDHPYYFSRELALAYAARSGFDVVAERYTDDGHWGMLLTPAEEREPDWDRLARNRDALLTKIWTLRARG